MRISNVFLAASALLAAAGQALAQGVGSGPVPPQIEEVGQWKDWLIAATFLAAVCVVVFKKSKRSLQ